MSFFWWRDVGSPKVAPIPMARIITCRANRATLKTSISLAIAELLGVLKARRESYTDLRPTDIFAEGVNRRGLPDQGNYY